MTNFNNAYSPSRRVVLDTSHIPSKTKQSFKNECDINTILSRFYKTGALTHVSSVPPQYGDFLNSDDYHSAMNRILAINDTFESLPSKIRSRFENDPAKLLDFLGDDSNRVEAIKLGLIDGSVDVNLVDELSAQKAVSAQAETSSSDA